MHNEEFPINSKIQEITSKAISYLRKPHDNTKLQFFILFSVIQIYKQQGKKANQINNNHITNFQLSISITSLVKWKFQFKDYYLHYTT